MDRIDNEILTLLLKDARVTLSEISNQVKREDAAVKIMENCRTARSGSSVF